MGNEIRNQQPAKKALMTASMASMLDNFNRNNIKLLLELGYTVTLAANFNAEEDSSPPGKLQRFRQEMEEKGCRVVHIDFSRKLSNIRKQFRSYRQIRALAAEKYDLVHCHSPICAALTRLVFRNQRKLGTKVIYTAHGFHFFRGAPVKNWLLYFPVEWVCARWTDILNTINREDYERAKRWLKAGKIVYLPGVGIDLEKFKPGSADREVVRKSLGIGKNEKMLLSVGELSRRKNHENVIRALRLIESRDGINKMENEKKRVDRTYIKRGIKFTSRLCRFWWDVSGPPYNLNHFQDEKQSEAATSRRETNSPVFPMCYVICGQGETEAELKALSEKLGLESRVLFLGYREDISELYQAADLFVFPSLQEGMPMALMEAIALKTPVICSDIRGNRELVPEKELRFDPQCAEDIAKCIKMVLGTDLLEIVELNYRNIRNYRIEMVESKIRKEYMGESVT